MDFSIVSELDEISAKELLYTLSPKWDWFME